MMINSFVLDPVVCRFAYDPVRQHYSLLQCGYQLDIGTSKEA